MIAIIFSKQDIAGMNMLARFRERKIPREILLKTIDEDIIFARGLDSLGADALIFASRHKAESGIPTLTIHPTGVFGTALPEFGGNSHELSFPVPHLMRSIYLRMLQNPPTEYKVSLEQTHHGPTNFRTPMCFVEIGSSEQYWRDENAAAFLVDCILAGIKTADRAQVVIGAGGNHYAALFSKLEAEKYAFGHMCPKYALDELTPELVVQMFEKSGAEKAILDRKGIKSKTRLLEVIGNRDVELI